MGESSSKASEGGEGLTGRALRVRRSGCWFCLDWEGWEGLRDVDVGREARSSPESTDARRSYTFSLYTSA